jgi:hypothetical protein
LRAECCRLSTRMEQAKAVRTRQAGRRTNPGGWGGVSAAPACRERKHDETGVDERPSPPAGSHLPRCARHHPAMHSARTFAAPSGSLVGWRFSAFCQE